VGGEAFEYTGTAKELLIGFFIALAVLTPIYIGYFLLGIMLEEKQALASLPLVVVMYALAHFAGYRARKYRATRTIFRGVRFWMKGAGWAYALRAILWDAATLLTLGLALPWAMASLERYRMRHTYFGNVQGDFVGTGWALFKRGWWVWALALLIIGGGMGAAAWLASAKPDMKDAVGGLTVMAILVAVITLAPLVMAIFSRWQMDGIRFGDIAVSSNLRKRAFYGLFFKWLFSSIGFCLALAIAFGIGAGVFGSFFKAAMESVRTEGLGLASVSAFVLIALAYLTLLLGIGIIQRYFFGRGMWALIVSSIAISNLQAVDEIVAAGQPSGVLGEGVADVLDFNIGI